MTQKKVPLYNGKPILFSADPVRLKRADTQKIETALTGLLKDIEEFTSKALKDASILSQLGLPLKLDPSPSPLGLHIPFARFDLLYDEGQIQVLELNTDGTSGYNVAQWLGTEAGLQQAEDPNYDLSDRLLKALLEHHPKAPEIALVDFQGIETSWEQKDLITRWSKKIPCHLADPAVKSWKPGALLYRRVMSWQLRSQPERATAFLDSWKKKEAIVVGGWSSDVGMSKAWPAFLKSSLTPETRLLDEKTVKNIKDEKDCWVLKGALSFSGRAVIRGLDLTQARWEASLTQIFAETKAGRPWIAQKRVPVPLYEKGPLELGLYMLNGKPSGYLCRWGHTDVISETSQEVLRPIQITS